jgi:hypothetical protein
MRVRAKKNLKFRKLIFFVSFCSKFLKHFFPTIVHCNELAFNMCIGDDDDVDVLRMRRKMCEGERERKLEIMKTIEKKQVTAAAAATAAASECE